MTEIKHINPEKSTVYGELLIIYFLGILVAYSIFFLDALEYFIGFLEHNESWEADGTLLILVYFSIALSIFSIRRWQESKVEIKARKDLEEQLVYLVQEADSASLTKSEFLANMSHELRTPLNSVIGYSDMLLEGHPGELNEKQIRYVGNISSSGKHLLELINQILDISKIESGNMDLHLETFIINEVLEEIELILHPLAAKKNINLIIDSDEKSREITADRLKLKQIIFNLASNAIKFTPDNGHVHINASRSNDLLKVKVADTGIGIRKSELTAIFEPFKQVEQMKNKSYEGTGLGLSIVKKFVELHQGRIWVESQVQIGSTFIFEIPLKDHASLHSWSGKEKQK